MKHNNRRDSREPREPRDHRNGREPRDTREPRNGRDYREPHEVPSTREPREESESEGYKPFDPLMEDNDGYFDYCEIASRFIVFRKNSRFVTIPLDNIEVTPWFRATLRFTHLGRSYFVDAGRIRISQDVEEVISRYISQFRGLTKALNAEVRNALESRDPERAIQDLLKTLREKYNINAYNRNTLISWLMRWYPEHSRKLKDLLGN